ncbi:alternative oxidase [Penicillium argentinense]|uniref:Alternative oxidase n=1 Tax=Penicillium argentinense TaxID=1131581 RepID=A0A9W9EHR6_9EURO|nr:alternative oxidase [Penicillium argentinense]KAJ5082023.1 alternative oxidase [Penicillium argentinense]
MDTVTGYKHHTEGDDALAQACHDQQEVDDAFHLPGKRGWCFRDGRRDASAPRQLKAHEARRWMPGVGLRLVVIGAQGLSFNALIISYVISPRICHRFVGYFEGVTTYIRAIADIEKGRLPEWSDLQAPDIAIHYWKMPEGQYDVNSLLLYIRVDEAKHREVNHTLGNLDQLKDPNPFTAEWDALLNAHPSKGVQNLKMTGWEKDEAI